MAAKVLGHKNMDDELASIKEPIFVNDLPLETEEDRQFLKQLAINQYDSDDVVSATPACRCGETRGAHRINKLCGNCMTKVTKPNSGKIESMLWVAAPRPIGLLPTNLLWVFCADALKANYFDGLSWICDPFAITPDTRAPKKALDIVKRFTALGIPRGMRSFIDNFDLILMKVIAPKITDLNKRKELVSFCEMYRNQIFARATPIPNKMAMVIEETGVAKYYDETIDSAVEAAYTAAATAGDEDLRRLESRFTKVVASMAKFCNDSVNLILLKKKGFLRRVCYGLRVKFAFRNVVTSQNGRHDYRGIGVPYHQLVSCLDPFIRDRLVKQHGMSMREATEYVMLHQKDCDPLLWGILEDMIDETPPEQYPNPAMEGVPTPLTTKPYSTGRGIGVIGTRFPSLDRGSSQQLFIKYITRSTVEISVLVLKAPNCDFDGDQLSFSIVMDNDLLDDGGFERFQPHYNIHDTGKPFNIRGIIGLPDVTVGNIAARLESEELVI
ncbi:RNA polymerase beta prime subunit [Vibrio phage BONAISHI]|nr:RNA polymerase beta prime subunit [Vibrio phage BONAISHI]